MIKGLKIYIKYFTIIKVLNNYNSTDHKIKKFINLI